MLQMCVLNERCVPGVVQATDACRAAADPATASVCILVSRMVQWCPETAADQRLVTDVDKTRYTSNASVRVVQMLFAFTNYLIFLVSESHDKFFKVYTPF